MLQAPLDPRPRTTTLARSTLSRVASYDGDDFYCDVALAGQQPLIVLAEDDQVLAFEHTRPYWPVHVVVVPKVHVGSLLALTDLDLAARLLSVVQRVAAAVLAEHGAAGVTTNLGRYQDSRHLHFHVHSGPPLH